MSEFFNVTLGKNISLDDGIISDKTGWSSEKIQKEIMDKRITRFEELQDVDVINKQDNQVVAYSKDTGKFTTINLETLKEATGLSVKQICKTGVNGTSDNPESIEIPINTLNFRVLPVDVLRYSTENKDDIVEIKNDFKNTEVTQFQKDNQILFDDKAHLKTEYDSAFNLINEFDDAVEYSIRFKKSDYKKVEEFKVNEDGVLQNLKTIAIPYDRLLIPINNLNLSNVRNIDCFKIEALGNNFRIVCSVDDGTTWKTFKNQSWENIDLEIESIKEKGIPIEVFNSINSLFWNELITANKIRFAYLFSMDNIQNIEEIDKLTFQYDKNGSWIQCNCNEFKATYVSNSLLKVDLYFSGDVKINYGTNSEWNTYEEHWTKETFKDLNLLANIKDIFTINKYYATSSSEFIIKNNIKSVNKDIDMKKENQLHLVITDNDIVILDAFIPPEDSQKYLLGISPNIKVFVKGQFDANLYMIVS
ncbi:signal peptidase II [Clostridium botulinum]|uniref:signal peptidase II n=1 Tax=Clostridium botulinum TaxID=1491 RepID=UPI001FA89DB1|nr:signal peptidase II [Clostridium botulinum]